MKKLVMLLSAAAVALPSCLKQEQDVEKPAMGPVSKGRTVTVEALETKTAVVEKENGAYGFTWKEGDNIQLYEFIYENHGRDEENATADNAFVSEPLAGDAAAASFQVDLSTTLANPGGGKYRYVAVYPMAQDVYWSDAEWYKELWEDTDASVPVHPVLGLAFPAYQQPTAGSFDPYADIVVSRPVVLDNRAEGSVPLYFSRVGGIVKMTVTGLPAGVMLQDGMLGLDSDFPLAQVWDYDLERGTVRTMPAEGGGVMVPDMPGGDATPMTRLQIMPTDVIADSKGEAVIWLRVPEGRVDELLKLCFNVMDYNAETQEYGETHEYVKQVDLKALGRSLRFENGRITEFTVALEPAPEMVLSYTYTDSQGEEQVASGSSYGLYLDDKWSPDAGTFVIDVQYSGDLSDVTVDTSDYDWLRSSFDPATGKLTLEYDANPDYETAYATSYGIGYRSGSITVSAGEIHQFITFGQYKRDFRNLGQTLTGYMLWKGGEDSTDLICNFTPEIICDDPSLTWTVAPYKDRNGLGHSLVKVTAQPLEVTDTEVTSDLVVRDPLNPSKNLTIRIVRFKKVTPGKQWLVAWASARRYAADYYYSGWYSFHVMETSIGSGVYDYRTLEYDAAKSEMPRDGVLPTPEMLSTPDDRGDRATPIHIEPIEGSDKYYIWVNLGKDANGDDIIRYIRKSSSLSNVNVFFDSSNGMGLVGIDDRDAYCKWDIYYVDQMLIIVNDADDNEYHENVGLLSMSIKAGWDDWTDIHFMSSARFGTYLGSSMDYKGSFSYFGVARHTSFTLYLPSLVPYEDAEPLPVKVTGVSVTPAEVSLEEGETASLTASVTPANAADKSVSWSSSKPSVATVDESGVVTAVKAGEATVTVTTTDGSFTAESKVTVTAKTIPVTGVTLTPSSFEATYNQRFMITAAVLPENATNKEVSFTVNSDILRLANATTDGLVQSVYAVNTGEAVITVTTADGGFTATCSVSVKNAVIPVESIQLSDVERTLKVGQDFYLSATVQPAGATNQDLTFAITSGSDVIELEEGGTSKGKWYKGIAPGEAVITVTGDGGVSASCHVTVVSTVAVQGVSLSQTQLSLNPGGQYMLFPVFTPSNPDNTNVSWSSSNTGVAIVYNGMVLAQAEGTAVITVTTEDGGYTAQCTVTVENFTLPVTSGNVDMGLPSGTQWAACNVGAETPDQYGDYVKWADVGTGEGYQAPTKEQIEELLANCDWSIAQYNGVSGIVFTSKNNGQKLFFPLAGYVFNDASYSTGSGMFLYLWTSTAAETSGRGYALVYDGQTLSVREVSTGYYACPVRPVTAS